MAYQTYQSHHAIIHFDDGNFFIKNIETPGFLSSSIFQDEYEAQLAWSIWLQYSKDKSQSDINQGEYQNILKMTFRLIGVKSKWS